MHTTVKHPRLLVHAQKGSTILSNEASQPSNEEEGISRKKVLDQLGGVGAGRQQADQRALVVTLHPCMLHVERDGLHEPLAQGVGDVVRRRNEGAVLTEGLDHTHALKFGQAVLVVWHLSWAAKWGWAYTA
eukprot:1158208-Pelagomonas_calceolata.AAC.7